MPRQEKNASEKRKQVEKGGSHPCMRASVCVNVARTPYRGLLLSPPFFLPFFSLLYLLCAPLYAPLLALRSRTCPQTAACLFNASSFPSSPSSSSLLRPCASLDSLSTGTSPLPQICFLSKMFPQAWPFSLYVSFRVVSYGFCNQDFFPHIFRALLFSSSLLAPFPLLLVPCSFSLSFLSSLRCFSAVAASPPPPPPPPPFVLFVPVISSSSCPSIPCPWR